jgi:hypothetical protein
MPPGCRPQSGRCLILMDIWRDPPCGRSDQPKKRARFEHSLEAMNERDISSWRCQKNFARRP